MNRIVRTFAAAKVNLSLTVHGRCSDGYHALSSLVAFADIGDHVQLDCAASESGSAFSVTVGGPMASAICGPNLIERAGAFVSERTSGIDLGRAVLTKWLPVEAGIGGGSADAAAYLRALQCVHGERMPPLKALDLAHSLGADVPVCLHQRVTWMHGIGEILQPLSSDLEPLHCVLVNSGVRLATGDVFRVLGAPLMENSNSPTVRDVDGWPELPLLRNDLEAPAYRLAPELKDVRAALEVTAGVTLVRMSGSGATHFALYASADAAAAAAQELREVYPDWWIAPTVLGHAPADPVSVPG